MTAEEWDVHYWRVYGDYRDDGARPSEAVDLADRDTIEQFGPRPREAL